MRPRRRQRTGAARRRCGGALNCAAKRLLRFAADLDRNVRRGSWCLAVVVALGTRRFRNRSGVNSFAREGVGAAQSDRSNRQSGRCGPRCGGSQLSRQPSHASFESSVTTNTPEQGRGPSGERAARTPEGQVHHPPPPAARRRRGGSVACPRVRSRRERAPRRKPRAPNNNGFVSSGK